ncbi:MAG: hypothetical protein R3C24_07130 [Cyanobacteriota/Melainabacteria group bacterium]
MLLNKEAVDALKVYQPLLRLTDLDLQFIVESRHADPIRLCRSYRDPVIHEEPLFVLVYGLSVQVLPQRVAEHRYISRKDFYLVVSRDHGTWAKRLSITRTTLSTRG